MLILPTLRKDLTFEFDFEQKWRKLRMSWRATLYREILWTSTGMYSTNPTRGHFTDMDKD